MIHWLIQTTAAHPGLANGQAPGGLLSADETAVFDGFKVHKRRQDWLLGRWTTKHLLREIIRQDYGQTIALDNISILPGKDGAPRVSFASHFHNRDLAFTVSISHSNRTSFCAAVTLSEWPLGADIEFIEPRSENFAADFFTEEEQAQIKRVAPEMQDTMVTAVWSGKEAALKAIRMGLRVDTRSLNLQIEAPKELPQTWRSFYIQWQLKPDSGHLPELKGWWMVAGQYVLTLVTEDDQGSPVLQ